MRDLTISRRSFLLTGSAFLLLGRSAALGRPPLVLEVKLEGRAADLGQEVVSFGLPLPPNFLADPRRVSITDADGREIEASVRSLEPWRLQGGTGSIRSLLIQFRSDFSREREQRVHVVFHQLRRRDGREFVPVSQTLIDEDGLKGPRVLAVLPAGWLCQSLVAGPQVPAAEAGPLAAYEQFVERSFQGSLAYVESGKYVDWLYDRTTCWYKMYVRTGARKYLEAAYTAANFVRLHTQQDGREAGIFTLKGADLKYVYPRAMHLHYLLTGDERARATGKIMAQYCLKQTDPVYSPAKYRPVSKDADPERGRSFWSPRQQGYGLLGILHGWELTGERAYWARARECVDAYFEHQRQPPDGLPPDGSLRQDWALYDPSETTFKGATSAWMMALLLDPLFQYWTLTSDRRVPQMVIKWCDFLDQRGMVPDGTKAYYVIDCLTPKATRQAVGELEKDMEMHDTELAYTFAMGQFFARHDAARRAIYRRRFDKLLAIAVKLDVNHPSRAYGWAFQASSRLVYFMRHAGGR
ncbi:MAG TPA: hypothetical protein VJT74_13515 [Pyrinomonadaceae bacterium]|nr:hypothetical protein [Pyrinomonadaceae bacterium]